MRKFLIFILFAGILTACNSNDSKPQASAGAPQAALKSKHSDSLNKSVDQVLTAYYQLTDAFVNWDSVAVNNRLGGFREALAGLKLGELKQDSANGEFETALNYVTEIRSNTQAMAVANTLALKRAELNTLSDNVFTLLRSIQYDAKPIYLEECPMALNNESQSGVWLSSDKKIVNPYIGNKHPKYHSGMLDCGSVKNTLNAPAE